MRCVVVVGVAWLGGCSDEVCVECVCVDDVCASPQETRSFPGPCRSRIHGVRGNPDFTLEGAFEYDAAGNVVLVRSTSNESVAFTYTADGAVAGFSGTVSMSREADLVRIARTSLTRTYDAAEFRLAAMPGRARRLSPYSDLGLLTMRGGLLQDLGTFTSERTGQTVTRTERRGALTIMQLDDRDRVIESKHYPNILSAATAVEVFHYRDDLFLGHSRSSVSPEENVETHFTYDLGGNLIVEDTLRGDPLEVTVREVFSYDCWE